jgi:type I restriction enzyme S subunit
MMSGWKVEKLGDVCEKIQDGSHFSPQKTYSEKKPDRYLYITSKNIRNEYMDLSNISYVDKEFHQSIYQRCNPEFGDVLLTKDGVNTGNITLNTLDEPFSLLSSVCLIKTNRQKLLPSFLKYYIQSPDGFKNITGQMTGMAIKRIVLHRIKSAKIPIPPLPEQQRIVAVLDEAFASIAQAKANAERNLVNARELFDLTLQNFLVKAGKQWGIKSLGDVCEKVEYGSSAKSQPSGTVPVLRMGNVQNGVFDWTNLVYTSDKDEIKKYLLKHNDVLFNRTNSPELVGKTAIYKSEMPAIFAGYLIRIHRKEDLLDADYLNYFLNSDIAMKYGKTVFISSVNQANINGQKLKSYPIPLPPLAEQRAIVGRLEALSAETGRLEAVYRQKVAALEELKKSVLQRAFAGGI